MKLLNIFMLLIIVSCSSFGDQFFNSKAGSLRKDYEAKAKKLMISSQGKFSSEAGIEVSNKGGNIIDVFTAVSFAISVERPQSTGLGGWVLALL